MSDLGLPLLDGLGLAALVKAGEVSAKEVVEDTISRIEAADGVLNTIVHEGFDYGRREVDNGLPDGPFTGVPTLIKNTNFEVEGMRMSSGSRLMQNDVSPCDSTIVTRYRKSGMVILGKSNAPEFALSFTTEPESFRPTRNPWDLTRGAGGSSGGASAAVAAGFVPVANSSDGAGSTRLPAAHCGLFGFKPSRMVNPVGPIAGEVIAGMTTPHVITWSVRDSAAVLDVTGGPDIGDPYAAPAHAGSYLDAVSRAPAPLRIGFSTVSPVGTEVSPDVIAAAERAAALCAELGHTVEEIAPADVYDGDALMRAWRMITGVTIGRMVLSRQGDSDPLAQLEAVNAEWAQEGIARPATEYLWAVSQLHQTGRAMGRFFQKYDILLTPATGEPAPLIGELAGASFSSLDSFYERFWQHGPFSAAFNASGAPAMSVPFGLTGSGLPVSAQFGAAFGNDDLLFSLAGQLEQAAPWFNRRPPEVKP